MGYWGYATEKAHDGIKISGQRLPETGPRAAARFTDPLMEERTSVYKPYCITVPLSVV